MKLFTILLLTLSLSPWKALHATQTDINKRSNTQKFLSFINDNNSCGNESWSCNTTVENKSGTFNGDICRRSENGKIACYKELIDTCVESNSGKTTTRSYSIFTGECVSSYNDCW